ncbi:hypothetical protein SAMN05444422_10288 [Halobiforma haloterrestris]|uniref:Halobacterial output domain-containing protein n=1 Tax=Natronobacterium haloterrestre TaxID=148448 RepID=A0A1I1E4P3_NATHA|nr:HalOD1 output domain-containing protein [Halobiforma haloterrestris]SFB80188.1 hypothetical protein SAMN05444422_10288 [Halobiforma haloterrestris]
MHERTPPASQPRPPEVYRVTHDPDGPATLSTTVVHALADCMGVDPTDGRISLYEAVDPDALDKLFRPRYDGTARTRGQVSFVVSGYRVTIEADGDVVIEPPAEEYRAADSRSRRPTGRR